MPSHTYEPAELAEQFAKLTPDQQREVAELIANLQAETQSPG
jgi:hypothetical protein